MSYPFIFLWYSNASLQFLSISPSELYHESRYQSVYSDNKQVLFLDKESIQIVNKSIDGVTLSSRFYEYKNNGNIYSIMANFKYNNLYSKSNYISEIKRLYPNILSEDLVALIRVRKAHNSGILINISGASVFDYEGKLVTKGPLSKDDNTDVDLRYGDARYFVGNMAYSILYGQAFDQ